MILSRRLVDHFGLGEGETVLGIYSCSLLTSSSPSSSSSSSLFSSWSSAAAHTRRAGWMILFQKAVAFAAHPRSILLPFKDVVAIFGENLRKKKAAEKESGIRIVSSDRRTFLFVHFQKREEAYSLLSLLWESDMESRLLFPDAQPQSAFSLSPSIPLKEIVKGFPFLFLFSFLSHFFFLFLLSLFVFLFYFSL